MAANLLRGGLGAALKQLDESAYARLFSPSSGAGPSGLRDRPRPFVLRAAHLNGATIEAGVTFHFDLHLFETRQPWIDLFAAAFADRLGSVQRIERRETWRMTLEPCAGPVRAIRVNFVTPTELKGADQPQFGILLARVRDRISTLRALYGAGPLEIDFQAMGDRASRIGMTRCAIRHVDAERTSRRTGQRHSLGGFVGAAEYAGELAEFVPYLDLARWTGVGRQTVWGKGEIVCEIL